MRDWQPFLGLPLWFWLFVFPSFLALFCLFYKDKARRIFAPLWKILDRIYTLSGVIAAGFMVLILLLIVGQMVSRWSGLVFPGGTEFAGYAMACTSFFALAYTLNHGAHIRVSIFLNMNDFLRYWLDAFAILVSAITATYFARYAIKTNFLSQMLNDRTQGLDQVPEWILTSVAMLGTWPWNWGDLWAKTGDQMVFTPVWLPQIAMSIGTVLLAIALWDNLYRLLINQESNIKSETIE
ncbi:MAG: TRAP transporter small permease [Nitratireductor sp.]